MEPKRWAPQDASHDSTRQPEELKAGCNRSIQIAGTQSSGLWFDPVELPAHSAVEPLQGPARAEVHLIIRLVLLILVGWPLLGQRVGYTIEVDRATGRITRMPIPSGGPVSQVEAPAPPHRASGVHEVQDLGVGRPPAVSVRGSNSSARGPVAAIVLAGVFVAIVLLLVRDNEQSKDERSGPPQPVQVIQVERQVQPMRVAFGQWYQLKADRREVFTSETTDADFLYQVQVAGVYRWCGALAGWCEADALYVADFDFNFSKSYQSVLCGGTRLQQAVEADRADHSYAFLVPGTGARLALALDPFRSRAEGCLQIRITATSGASPAAHQRIHAHAQLLREIALREQRLAENECRAVGRALAAKQCELVELQQHREAVGRAAARVHLMVRLQIEQGLDFRDEQFCRDYASAYKREVLAKAAEWEKEYADLDDNLELLKVLWECHADPDVLEWHLGRLRVVRFVRLEQIAQLQEPTPEERRQRQAQYVKNKCLDEGAALFAQIQAQFQLFDVLEKTDREVQERADLSEEQKRDRIEILEAARRIRLGQVSEGESTHAQEPRVI